MAQAQKARKLEIELPAVNAESMERAAQDIYVRKYIRYKEGAIRYSVSLHTFQEMAIEAGAVIKCKGISLVDTTIFEEYLDSFRIKISHSCICNISHKNCLQFLCHQCFQIIAHNRNGSVLKHQFIIRFHRSWCYHIVC